MQCEICQKFSCNYMLHTIKEREQYKAFQEFMAPIIKDFEIEILRNEVRRLNEIIKGVIK